MQTEKFYRINELANQSARPAYIHTYKTGSNAGAVKHVGAREARSGIVGVSAKTIYQWVKEGKFPKPIKLSAGVVVWRKSDIDAWFELLAEKTSA